MLRSVRGMPEPAVLNGSVVPVYPVLIAKLWFLFGPALSPHAPLFLGVGGQKIIGSMMEEGIGYPRA